MYNYICNVISIRDRLWLLRKEMLKSVNHQQISDENYL